MCSLLGCYGKAYLGRWHLPQETAIATVQPPQLLSAWCGPSATSLVPSLRHLDSSPFSPLLRPSSHLGPASSQMTMQDKWITEIYLQSFPAWTRTILVPGTFSNLISCGLFYPRKYVSLQTLLNLLQSEFSNSLHGISWVVLLYLVLQVSTLQYLTLMIKTTKKAVLLQFFYIPYHQEFC